MREIITYLDDVLCKCWNSVRACVFLDDIVILVFPFTVFTIMMSLLTKMLKYALSLSLIGYLYYLLLYKYDQVLASRVTKPFEQSTFGKMSRSQKILSTYFPKILLPNLAVGVFRAKN